MARLRFQDGLVFDGSGAAPAAADVVTEVGRIVEVGPGLPFSLHFYEAAQNLATTIALASRPRATPEARTSA